eukprot:TRINITY_DN8713_c0_g1_i2.p1 TRINITY_DN8713_c0_g1~~TRINITY_DN8713_c0_g1_i2.p1  ORF type:complete len:236 (-),score=6.55 TRINITY_DN8713_c0_g1_i2:255-962(-)
MEAIVSIFKTSCLEENFDLECALTMLPKIVGLLIILGSIFVKVPQIWKIIKFGSTLGLSNIAFYLESLCYTFIIVYNIRSEIPLISFVEQIIVWFQVLVLVICLWIYSRTHSLLYCLVATLSFAFICFVLFFGVSNNYLPWILSGATLLIFGARVPQIILNFKNGYSGHLSFITCFFSFIGCGIKILVTLKEETTMYFLTSYIIGTVLNGIVVAQILWYWKVTNGVIEKERQKQE